MIVISPITLLLREELFLFKVIMPLLTYPTLLVITLMRKVEQYTSMVPVPA